MTAAALTVDRLTVRVGPVPAVHDVSFNLSAGTRTGLIGESGSGKTLTALAIMGLLPETLSASGRVLYDGVDLMAASERTLCRPRRHA
jgi:ABC-type glutathione transport system ATPase component